MNPLTFAVTGMKCGGCASRAKEAVSRLPGVESAEFDHQVGRGVVHGRVDPQAVIRALAAIGYGATVTSTV